MPDIRHRVAISAPLESVYEAVATTEGLSEWWTRDGVRGRVERGIQTPVLLRPAGTSRGHGGHSAGSRRARELELRRGCR